MSRKFVFCLLAGFIMGSFGLQFACADGQTPPSSRPSDSAAEIKAALNDPTAMEFSDTPLCDVIEYLKDYHHQKHSAFEIVLDTKALNELGVTSDTPITKNLKGITLRSALRLMLRDLGLTFVIRDEVLLITSPDEAAKPLFKRVYDVADLVPPEEREKGTAFDSLVGTVSKTADVDPANKDGLLPWISSIKSAELAVIVVYQTEEAQEEVADLLVQLRAARHPK
jgi:hypothetical protein